MMNVIAVCAENGLTAEKTPHNGERCIQKRDRQGNNGSSHAQQGCRLLTPEHAIASQQESDEQASAVPQKNSCGVEVISQKSNQTPDQRNSRQGKVHVVLHACGKQGGGARNQRHSGREPIYSVKQINGVRACNQPNDCQRIGKPRCKIISAERMYLDSREKCDSSGKHLARKFLPRS